MEQCPHIIGMSTCEICQEEYINELEAENARLRKSIENMADVAISAVDHVASANYPEREHEALGWVDEAYSKAMQQQEDK